MSVSEANRRRYRMIGIARAVKELLEMVPERFAKAVLGRFLLGPLLRWLFLAEDGRPHRGGEIVLAQLRERFGGPTFDPDPIMMARKTGRREVFDELMNFLHLDEEAVHKLMRLDDGLE